MALREENIRLIFGLKMRQLRIDAGMSLSDANASSVLQPLESSVALGLKMCPQLKKVVRFWNDAAIPVQVAGQTCERCGLSDCPDRVPPPEQLELNHQLEAMKQVLLCWPASDEPSNSSGRPRSGNRNKKLNSSQMI